MGNGTTTYMLGRFFLKVRLRNNKRGEKIQVQQNTKEKGDRYDNIINEEMGN
jgi:hypothetical protein